LDIERILESFLENIPRAMEASEANPFGVSIFVIAISIIFSIIFFSRSPLKVRIFVFVTIGISSFLIVLVTHAVQFGEFQGPDIQFETDFPFESDSSNEFESDFPFEPTFPQAQPFPQTRQPQPIYGSACYTSFGSCPLPSSFPVNSPCTCSNFWNTFPGTVGTW